MGRPNSIAAYDRAVIVALDVGNTNITVAVVRGGDVTSSRRAPTPADDMESTLSNLLDAEGASLDDVEGIVLVGVVPLAAAKVAELAQRREIELLVADSTTVPIPIRVDRPAEVGDDRLVNAFAAARLHGTPAIVVDMGTATTFDVVSADGAFLGGAIAPGVGLGVDALATQTAKLPRVALVLPPRAIGRDTVSAMQSGSVLGYMGLIGELVRAITAELTVDGDAQPKVILTGGLSSAPWAGAIPGIDVIDPLLTLRGLAFLHAEVAGKAPAHTQA
jgi:type III pantothenate kinase